VVNFLTPNMHLAPFDDVHCRLALAYGFDRNAVARVMQETVHPTYDIVPKGMLGYYPGKDNPHYRPATARMELARCPGRTIPVELVYVHGAIFDNEENAVRAVASMLRAVGMNVRLKPDPLFVWFGIVSTSLDRTKTQLVEDAWQ
jgi:ABC-type transport system substrate-binding protein